MPGDALALAQFADRIGLNLAALLAIGLAFHVASGVVERDARRRLRPLAIVAAVAVIFFAVIRFVVLTAQMGDGTTLLDLELLPLAWTALGPSTLAFGGGAVLGAAGILWRSRVLAAASVAALGAGFGLTGHTQGLAEPGLMPAVVAVHVFIAGFWIAAPVTLFPRSTISDALLLARLRHFSRLAVIVIPLLIVLGVWLAWRLAGGLEPLVGSLYGQLLLVKLAVGVLAMGFGALNKQVVTARIAADPAEGKRWLRRTLFAEASLFAIAIVAVSAATTLTGPVD